MPAVKGRSKNVALKPMLDKYLYVAVEAGLNGGYIATVGQSTGNEQRGVHEAIRHALQCEQRRVER